MAKNTKEGKNEISLFYAEIAQKVDQIEIEEMMTMFESTRIEVKAQLQATGNVITCLVDAMTNQQAERVFEDMAKLLNVSYKIISFETVVLNV